MQPNGGEWTSLEIAKLVVGMMVPLAIFALGVVVARQADRAQREFWRSQKKTEWRQTLFNSTIADLNKLYCAFNYCGSWTECAPPEIIAAKRRLDRNIYGYDKLLGISTRTAYDELMAAGFEVERGRGRHLRLRCNVDMYRDLPGWKPEFEKLFVPAEERTRRDEFRNKYERFITKFFESIGVE